MRHPSRSGLLVVAGAVALLGSVVVPAATAHGATAACTVEYTVADQWDAGFQGDVRTTDDQARPSSWSPTFDFSGGQEVTRGRNAGWSRSGTTVTAAGESHNDSLGVGASVSAGFLASWTGSDPPPTAFEPDGTTRNADPDPSAPPTDPPPTDPPPADPPSAGDGKAPALRVSGDESVDAVRATGAGNVILADGLAYSDDLGQWPTYRPGDPAGNLAASHHAHDFDTRAGESCWNSALPPVVAHVPPVAGEIGENTCSHGFTDRVMKRFDDRGPSCPGRTRNTWERSSGPSLISAYDGTPTAFGAGLRDHLRAPSP